ncbi:MAG: hypothetical protein H7Y15_15730 [Pseudonocardia sp.]|nr:hypothetical protein [Pseudonocardia sp.]
MQDRHIASRPPGVDALVVPSFRLTMAQTYVQHADAKAGYLAGFQFALLATVVSQLDRIHQAWTAGGWAALWALSFVVVLTSSNASGAFLVLQALRPRVTVPDGAGSFGLRRRNPSGRPNGRGQEIDRLATALNELADLKYRYLGWAAWVTLMMAAVVLGWAAAWIFLP